MTESSTGNGQHDDVYGWELHGFVRNQNYRHASFQLLYIVTLLIVASITHKVGKVWKFYWIPEVGITMAVGALIGYFASQANQSDILTGFSSEFFFLYMLPIIIFTSGFQQSFSQFCQYYGEIITFAVLGTVLSAFVIGYSLYWLGLFHVVTPLTLIECLSFGSMISATDPVSTLAIFAELRVEPCLYVIVLGSSILDDAIAVILLSTFNHFVGTTFNVVYATTTIISYFLANLIGSTLIGCFIGFFMAYLVKLDASLRSRRTILAMTCIAVMYISYLVAFVFQLSGIISSLYAAMIFRKYLARFVSAEDLEYLQTLLESMGFIAEGVVFFSIGMSLYDPPRESSYDPAFIFAAFALCILGRAAFVYPLSFILNQRYTQEYQDPLASMGHSEEKPTRSVQIILAASGASATVTHERVRRDFSQPLQLNIQHMILFSGLRGPISYAASLLFPNTLNHSNLIITTTRAIMLLTIYLKGGLTADTLKFLQIRQGVNSQASSTSGPEEIVTAFSCLGNLEAKYILPLFDSDRFSFFDNNRAGLTNSLSSENSSMITSPMRHRVRRGATEYVSVSPLARGSDFQFISTPDDFRSVSNHSMNSQHDQSGSAFII